MDPETLVATGIPIQNVYQYLVFSNLTLFDFFFISYL